MKKDKTKSIEFDYRTITSYEKGCERKKIDPIKSLPNVKYVPEFLKKYIIAVYKLAIIASAIFDRGKLDWTNGKLKYQPLHWVKADKKHPSGFGLSRSVCGDWSSRTGVGSHLCDEDSEKVQFFAENFQQLWMDAKLENY